VWFTLKITGITIDHYAVFPLKMFQIFFTRQSNKEDITLRCSSA